MKILHLCLCGPYTDNWGYQDNLLPQKLQEKGIDNTVIALMSDYDGKYSNYQSPISYFLNGVKIIRLIPTKNKIKAFFYHYNVYKMISDEKPDCVFVHCAQTYSGIYAVKYKRKNNNKCVIFSDDHADFFNSPTRSDLFHRILYFIRNRKLKKCWCHYDAIWGITPGCIEFCKKAMGITSKEIGLLPLGHDISSAEFDNAKIKRQEVRDIYGIDDKSIVLITGGKIDNGKKTIELVKAFKALNREGLYLFIFGRMENKEYGELLVKEIGDLSGKKIFLTGELSVSEYTNLYFASDIAVFPGGQSVLWQQAIGCGLPLIVNKKQNVDYLDVGGNVCFADGYSPDSIANAINQCIDNNHYLKMAEIASMKGREFFSYSRLADVVIDKYNEVCNARKSR